MNEDVIQYDGDVPNQELVARSKEYLREHNIPSPPTNTPWRIIRGSAVFLFNTYKKYSQFMAALHTQQEPPYNVTMDEINENGWTCGDCNLLKALGNGQFHCTHPWRVNKHTQFDWQACKFFEPIKF